MVRLAIVFFVIATVSAVLGFTDWMQELAIFARILFFLFIVLFIVTTMLGRSIFGRK